MVLTTNSMTGKHYYDISVLIWNEEMQRLHFFAVTANEILYSQVRHWKRGIDSCQPIMAESAAKPSSDVEVEGLSSSSETSEEECIRSDSGEFIL